MAQLNGYGLGCRRDLPDTRDYFALRHPDLSLPTRLSYRDRMLPVRNQGDEGSCTGFATAALLEGLAALHQSPARVLSPRFLYDLAKAVDGEPTEEGTYPRVILKVAAQLGACSESSLPYRPHVHPELVRLDELADEAATSRIREYARITSLTDMRAAMLANGPLLAGVTVYPGWERLFHGETVVPDPEPGTEPLGGHAITLVGYDDATQLVEFKNHWTAAFGDGGYGKLHYRALLQDSDLWTAYDLVRHDHLVIVRPSEWIKQPGLPAVDPVYPTTLQELGTELLRRIWELLPWTRPSS